MVAASRALFGGGDLAELDEATLARRGRRAAVGDGAARTGSPSSTCWWRPGWRPAAAAARRTIERGRRLREQRQGHRRDAVPAPADLLHGRWLVLRRGRRTLAAVELRRTERAPAGRDWRRMRRSEHATGLSACSR